MNPSKNKGTAAETAVVNAAVAAGITARRVALAGALDQGDVWLANGRVVIEVKAGNMAHAASVNQTRTWFYDEAQPEAERVAACDMAVLVVKRKGSGQARDWRAFVTVADYAWAVGLNPSTARIALDRLIEMPFGDLLDDLAAVL